MTFTGIICGIIGGLIAAIGVDHFNRAMARIKALRDEADTKRKHKLPVVEHYDP